MANCELVACKNCATEFRPKKKDRISFCSRACGFDYRKRNARPAGVGQFRAVYFKECQECRRQFTTKSHNAKFCHANCVSRYANRKAVGTKPVRVCGGCSKEFQSPYGVRHRAFCSDPCRTQYIKRIHRMARKAKLRAATVERFDPLAVLDRDCWQCQICGVETPRQLRGTYLPTAPEVDHIVPLAKGGDHSMANTQCACRSCNSIKSDSIIDISMT